MTRSDSQFLRNIIRSRMQCEERIAECDAIIEEAAREAAAKNVCCNCAGDGFLTSLDDHERQAGIMDSCYHCCETGHCDCTEQQKTERVEC